MTENKLAFEYLEIRPCINEPDGDISSFASWEEYRESGRTADFWTIYGRDESGLAHAIGDFTSFEIAEQIMWAIYAPVWKARDMLTDGEDKYLDIGAVLSPAEQATSILEDAINQCSNGERL
ncbi:hypothetical protein IB276_33055 [Ensifer sp. ENS04]|uniref:hypothetical protein n=1 Tax=Ensifer sp. ENS04 TaxID=2769281 RepID=UPI00178501F3|nr:hypothetical protein [Ensifer sp. ENS04]MBD9544276.1 hypothetical protein [Ensifer sp. ENS04]